MVGRGGVDRPGRGGRGRVGVSGRVDRPHFEGMRAVGKARSRPVGVATGPAVASRSTSGTGRTRRRSRRCRCPRRRSWRLELLLERQMAPESIEVVGAVVSTVQVELAGVGVGVPGRHQLPALRSYASRRRARSRPARRRSQPSSCVAVEPAPEAATPVRRRRRRERESSGGRPDQDRAGPSRSRSFGAVVSTVQVKLAGVASVFPAWSIARTSKLWEPSASPE